MQAILPCGSKIYLWTKVLSSALFFSHCEKKISGFWNVGGQLGWEINSFKKNKE